MWTATSTGGTVTGQRGSQTLKDKMENREEESWRFCDREEFGVRYGGVGHY